MNTAGEKLRLLACPHTCTQVHVHSLTHKISIGHITNFLVSEHISKGAFDVKFSANFDQSNSPVSVNKLNYTFNL